MPTPAITRHNTMPCAVCWNAITTVAAVYRSNDEVKIKRRPKRSAANPKISVPTSSPAKVAATKLARPLNPKNAADVLVKSPLRTGPGPTYAVKNKS